MTRNPLNRAWRFLTFADDDDNTPQGKLARGTFYIFYAIVVIVILSVVAEALEHWWKS